MRRHAARAPGGQHHRGDGRRAARGDAAARRGRRLLARQRAGVDLLQQAADAHPHEVGRAHLQAGEQPGQHEVDAVQLRAAGAAGQHQGRACADAAEADQVAGIDRHAEMQDFAAGAHDARRADVAPVHHRRGADHQQQVGALAAISDLPAPGRSATSSCGQCTGGSSVPVRWVIRCSVAAMVFSVTLSFRPGSSVTTRPTLQVVERMQRQRRAALARQRLGHRQHGAGHRERDDLDGRDQVLRRHHRVIRQGADGQRLVDRVQPVDLRGVDAQQAGRLGEQVDPAGGGAASGRAAGDTSAAPGDRRRCPPARRRVPGGRR